MVQIYLVNNLNSGRIHCVATAITPAENPRKGAKSAMSSVYSVVQRTCSTSDGKYFLPLGIPHVCSSPNQTLLEDEKPVTRG